MTRLLSTAGILLLFVAVANGDTYVTSNITTSQTWGPSESPYIIQADIEITNDSTLTMDPGTEVRFDDGYSLETEHGSALKVEGEAGNPVLFTSNAASPGMSSWHRINVSGNNRSSFDYCIVEYAQYGIRVAGTNPSPWIRQCTIRDCATGIFIASASPLVENCDIYACWDGVIISGNASEPPIRYSDICDNMGWNLYVMAFPEPAVTIDCEDNWWGTDVEGEIQQKIYDNTDNPAVFATIDYDPWLHEAPVEASSWGRVKAMFAR